MLTTKYLISYSATGLYNRVPLIVVGSLEECNRFVASIEEWQTARDGGIRLVHLMFFVEVYGPKMVQHAIAVPGANYTFSEIEVYVSPYTGV